MNQNELRDIVDENDNVIGQDYTWDIKTKGIRHRSVQIWIVNSKGELLLQKRSKNKRVCPSTWESAASGGVDAGESYGRAAQRELEEETGIKTRLKKLGKEYIEFDYGKDIHNKEFTGLFLGFYDGEYFAKEDELEELKLFTVEEIEKMLKEDEDQFTFPFVFLFRKYRQHLNTLSRTR